MRKIFIPNFVKTPLFESNNLISLLTNNQKYLRYRYLCCDLEIITIRETPKNLENSLNKVLESDQIYFIEKPYTGVSNDSIKL